MTRSAEKPTFRRTVEELIRARFPLLYVETAEEERLGAEIEAIASEIERKTQRRRRVFTWDLLSGMRERGTTQQAPRREARARSEAELLLGALDEVEAHDGAAIFVLHDVHWFLGAHRHPPNPQVIRRLRSLAAVLNRAAHAKTVVLAAPTTTLPEELQKDVYVVDFSLPSEEELRQVLRRLVDENRAHGRIAIDLGPGDEERLTSAALGLTLNEAENAFARAMVTDERLDAQDVATVLEEKRQAIRKTGILDYVDTGLRFERDLGGLGSLRQWLDKRNGSWLDEARRWGVQPPKGVLIIGVPGCGKSLTAKCMGSLWGLPLLRLDVGRIFAGIVGGSEQNMRAALRTAEAISPCVLWIDEIEKGFSQARGDLDSGVSRRVFGTFLTWMQDKEKLVFVIATANTIDALPPEFLRKGRFDEIFFVDLPTAPERMRIFEIHLRRRLQAVDGRNGFEISEPVLEQLAAVTEGFSGAEIEQAVESALFDAYSERRALRRADLERALANMTTLARTQAEQIQAMRRWASERAVLATSPDHLVGYGDASEGDLLGARGGRTIDF